MTSRNYSATAVSTTLAAGCTSSATSIQVAATTGFPAAPFLLALDYGTASQELVLVTAVAGTTLTVTRAYDSTTGVTHSLGAVVKHVHSAIDFRDSRTHENASSGVHGATGSVVGTTDAQALSNKDLTAGTNTFPTSLVTLTGAQALTNKDLSSATNTLPATVVQTTDPTAGIRVKCATTANITLSGTQTIDTISAGVGDLVLVKNQTTASQNGVYTVAAGAWSRSTGFNSATKIAGAIVSVLSGSQGGTDWNTTFKSTDTLDTTSMAWAQLVDTSSTQTLTNKTLTSPTITSPNIDTLAGVTGVGQTRYAAKAADQSNSTTTYVDDNTLTFSVVANAVYLIDYGMSFTCSTAGGAALRATGPTGATFTNAGGVVNATPYSLGSNTGSATWNTGTSQRLRLVTAGTAGTVTLQFAQAVADATATVAKAGSFMSITRVA